MLEDYNFLHSSFKEKNKLQTIMALAGLDPLEEGVVKSKLEEWFSQEVLTFNNPEKFFEFLNKNSLETILILKEGPSKDEFFRSIRVSGKKVEVISISSQKSNLNDLRLRLENFFGNQANDMGLTTKSPKMKVIIEEIKVLAAKESNILVSGPSGSGKKSVAEVIHKLSSRAKNELIHINFNSLGPTLVERDIFKIKTDDPQTGTIYLQNIEKLPHSLRIKVLDFIKNKKLGPRFIFGTSLGLSEFREVDQELFNLVGENIITIPPLSSRKEDIPIIIDQFIRKYSSLHNSKAVRPDDEALKVLINFDWPSNVLELENFIERLVILHGGATIGKADLPEKFKKGMESNIFPSLPSEGLMLKKFLYDIEMSLISQALSRSGGNKNKAAKFLGLNRTTLVEKLKKILKKP